MQTITTLNIALPDTVRAFVEAEVTAGGYSGMDEYFLALVREAQERKTETPAEQLRHDVQQGFAQIERGEYTEYSSGQEAADKIIAQGLQRMAEWKTTA